MQLLWRENTIHEAKPQIALLQAQKLNAQVHAEQVCIIAVIHPKLTTYIVAWLVIITQGCIAGYTCWTSGMLPVPCNWCMLKWNQELPENSLLIHSLDSGHCRPSSIGQSLSDLGEPSEKIWWWKHCCRTNRMPMRSWTAGLTCTGVKTLTCMRNEQLHADLRCWIATSSEQEECSTPQFKFPYVSQLTWSSLSSLLAQVSNICESRRDVLNCC